MHSTRGESSLDTEPTRRLPKSIWSLAGAACLALASTSCSHGSNPEAPASTTTTPTEEFVITEEDCKDLFYTPDAFGGNGHIQISPDGTFDFVGEDHTTTTKLPEYMKHPTFDEAAEHFCIGPIASTTDREPKQQAPLTDNL